MKKTPALFALLAAALLLIAPTPPRLTPLVPPACAKTQVYQDEKEKDGDPEDITQGKPRDIGSTSFGNRESVPPTLELPRVSRLSKLVDVLTQVLAFLERRLGS